MKTLADLLRGLAKVDKAQWREAATLAEELGATEAIAAGLRLLAQGQRLADELALPRRMSVELAIRIRSGPQEAIFFERLRETAGIRPKIALIARKLFPTTAYLRTNAPAPRGRLGLVWAYARQPFLMACRFGPASFFAWLRVRRQAKAPDSNAVAITDDSSRTR